MEATQPARLGDFEFDAIIKRPETLSSKIPGYATEEGYSASDHICLEAVTLDVTAVISNAPITWADRHPASSSRVQSAVEELRQLWEKRMPMTFTAGGDSYENVCIESVTFPKEESNSERIELMYGKLPMQFQLESYEESKLGDYICDTVDDLKDLPEDCEMGSIARIITPPAIYRKNSAGKWILQFSSKGVS